MTYNPEDKFTQPESGWITLCAGPSNEEIREAQERIRQGEPQDKVYAEIDERVAERERLRRDQIASEVGDQT